MCNATLTFFMPFLSSTSSRLLHIYYHSLFFFHLVCFVASLDCFFFHYLCMLIFLLKQIPSECIPVFPCPKFCLSYCKYQQYGEVQPWSQLSSGWKLLQSKFNYQDQYKGEILHSFAMLAVVEQLVKDNMIINLQFSYCFIVLFLQFEKHGFWSQQMILNNFSGQL